MVDKDSVLRMQLWDNPLLTVVDLSCLAASSLSLCLSSSNQQPLLPYQLAIKCHAGIHQKIRSDVSNFPCTMKNVSAACSCLIIK